MYCLAGFAEDPIRRSTGRGTQKYNSDEKATGWQAERRSPSAVEPGSPQIVSATVNEIDLVGDYRYLGHYRWYSRRLQYVAMLTLIKFKMVGADRETAASLEYRLEA